MKTPIEPYGLRMEKALAKHYMALTVLYVFVGMSALVLAIVSGLFVVVRHTRPEHHFPIVPELIIIGPLLALSLAGVFWITQIKKPPLLTAGDAYLVGIWCAGAGIFFSLALIVNLFFGSDREAHSIISGLVGISVPIIALWIAPVYWFHRAKRLKAAEPPARHQV